MDKKVDNGAQGFKPERQNRLYDSRRDGGRGLASFEDCVDASIRGFEDYILKSKERLMTAAHESIDSIKTNRTTKNRKEKGRKTIWI